MIIDSATLYYAHDPMCSWCWGFRPVWNELQLALKGRVNVQYVLGGLATDTQQPMSEQMQKNIQDTWRVIQKEIPGTKFNFDFWKNCQPRRSTHLACRAVIAARMQQAGIEQDILLAIQQAYYLQAQNPSDLDTLINIAKNTGLDEHIFVDDIQSATCQKVLFEEIQICRQLNMQSFPGLVLKQGELCTLIKIDYTDSKKILAQIL